MPKDASPCKNPKVTNAPYAETSPSGLRETADGEDNAPPLKFVYFKVGTTGLEDSDEISRLDGYDPASQEQFRQYELTSNDFEGYEKKRDAVSLEEGLRMFIDWLQTLGKVVLVGHSSEDFHAPRLVRALARNELLDSFNQTVLGFVDTLPLIRMMVPPQKRYTLRSLLRTFCPELLLEPPVEEGEGDESGNLVRRNAASFLHELILHLEQTTGRSWADMFRQNMFTSASVLA